MDHSLTKDIAGSDEDWCESNGFKLTTRKESPASEPVTITDGHRSLSDNLLLLADTSIVTQSLSCFDAHYEAMELELLENGLEDEVECKSIKESVCDDLNGSCPVVFMCDTHYEVEVYSRDEDEYRPILKGIKEVLQISDETYDERLKRMLDLSDGGSFRIFFMGNAATFMPLNGSMVSADITFTGETHVGVTDHERGGGCVVAIPHTFTFPLKFDVKPIRIEEVIKHNWAEVAFMTWNWCRTTKFSLSNIVYKSQQE